LTERGGPPPLQVLEQIMDLADSSTSREAWFGTHKLGKAWDGTGICVLLAAPTLDAIIAEVIDRADEAPDEPATIELYGERPGFVACGISGTRSVLRSSRLKQFRGTVARANKARLTSLRDRSLSHTGISSMNPSMISRPKLAQGSLKRTDRAAVSVPIPDTRSVTVSGQELWPRPEVPVCGVDFSGGEEDQRYGNRKIWIAEWLPEKSVALRCGWGTNTADKICRSDLAPLIKLGGWWSLDFPFGIAKETARALELTSWPEWLSWCPGKGDATMLRDYEPQNHVVPAV
jgi:hypothetical protein